MKIQDTLPPANILPDSEPTCPDSVASLVNSHLGADMHQDFWLLTCGCLSCSYHGSRLRAGRGRTRAHSEGFVEVGPWNDGSKRSGRGADDGHSSASLSAQTHGHFGLGAPWRCPEGRGRTDEFRALNCDASYKNKQECVIFFKHFSLFLSQSVFLLHKVTRFVITRFKIKAKINPYCPKMLKSMGWSYLHTLGLYIFS